MSGPWSTSILLARPVFAALAGIDPPALGALHALTGIAPLALADADARISPEQLRLAWSELARRAHDPQIALRVAASTAPGSFGIVEYLCRSAPTLGAALRQWTRYLNLLNDAVLVGLVDEEGTPAVRVLLERDEPVPQAHELCFALLFAQARLLGSAELRPLSVSFAHPPAGDVRAYTQWFQAPVQFSAPLNELVFPRGAFELPLVTADASLLTLLTRHADALLAKGPFGPPLTSQVRRVLCELLRDGDSGIEAVAARLGLAPRTLQRRLRDEGSSFQAVRDEICHALAARYLEDDRLSISEVSFLLGFSEPSAFYRAFKRWTGLTPVESRTKVADSERLG